MRLAAAVDRPGDAHEVALRRIALPLAKFWVCKRTPAMVAEALECLGGNGYVEESGLPRLYRESPLNSIWEGAGNVNCLDVLRALAKSPESLDAFVAEIRLAEDSRLERALAGIELELEQVDETRARYLVERLALTLQASLLLRHGDPAVAEAFCATRLEGGGGRAFGTLPRGLELEGIVERHRPLAAVA
jgi:putative acyl-CoA dehydrogenase